MHDDRNARRLAKVMRRREMIRVCVRVDDVTDPQPITGSVRVISVGCRISGSIRTAAQVASHPTR